MGENKKIKAADRKDCQKPFKWQGTKIDFITDTIHSLFTGQSDEVNVDNVGD